MLFVSLLTLIVAIPLYTYRISPYTYVRITTIALIYSAFITFNSFYIESIQSGISIYSGLFQVTVISQRIEIFIYIIGSMILFGWRKESYQTFFFIGGKFDKLNNSILESGVPTYNEFSLMIIFTSVGASFLLSRTDLVSIYLAIELQSFAVYILATLYRNSESATSAGLKYFLLGGLSSALILLGTRIIYSYTGITQIEGIFNLVRSSYLESRIHIQDNRISGSRYDSTIYNNYTIIFGIVLVTIGFLFKVAAAPFHSWAPDVYDGVPTIITSWITTMPKISIFILLLEIHSGIDSIPTTSNVFNSRFRGISPDEIISSWNISSQTLGLIFKNLLLTCSIISLLIGTIVGLSQYRIKRLLAFSTISHVGFILLALAIFTEESIDSFLFYIIQYSVTNVNVFLILLAFSYSGRDIHIHSKNSKGYNNIGNVNISNPIIDITFIDELKGQFYKNPMLSIRFAISLFSMAGIPPLIGFFAKQMVLYSAIHNGYYFISIIAILVSVISASYYLKIIQVMYFSGSRIQSKNDESRSQINRNINSNVSSNNSVTYPNRRVKNSNKSYSPSEMNSISNIHSILISIFTIFITMFMVHPTIITNRSEILRLSIFNN